MSFSWQITPEVAWSAMASDYADIVESDIVALCESLLDPIQEWMRANHGWTNRSGAAEAGLYTDLSHVARMSVTILLSHGPAIEYAEYLETVRAGSLGVIAPAVDWWGPKVFNGVQEIMARRGG